MIAVTLATPMYGQVAIAQDAPRASNAIDEVLVTRGIEIHTSRWSTCDAAKLGEEPMDPVSIQERAVTSAIWYQTTAEQQGEGVGN